MRPLTEPEVTAVCQRLQGLHLPMSERTLEYIRDRLTRAAPLVRVGEEAHSVNQLAGHLERIGQPIGATRGAAPYARSIVTPKSNIGTLVGPRAVRWPGGGHHTGHREADPGPALPGIPVPRERGWARFHTAPVSAGTDTGVHGGRVLPAGVQSGALPRAGTSRRRQPVNLLHPQQSTKHPQTGPRSADTVAPPSMLLYLDPHRVDVRSCHAVMNHLRGKLLATNLGSFARGPWRPLLNLPLSSLPPLLGRRLVVDLPEEDATSINGLCIPIDNRALVCLGARACERAPIVGTIAPSPRSWTWCRPPWVRTSGCFHADLRV